MAGVEGSGGTAKKINLFSLTALIASELKIRKDIIFELAYRVQIKGGSIVLRWAHSYM